MRLLFTWLLVGTVYIGFSQVSPQMSLEEANRALDSLENADNRKVDSLSQACDVLIAFYQKEGLACKEILSLTYKSGYLKKDLNYEEASKCILKAKKLFEKNQCGNEVLAYIYRSQIDVYLKLTDYEKADSLCWLTIDMYDPSWVNKKIVVSAYLSLGANKNDLKTAIPLLDSAYELAEKYGITDMKQMVLINRGTVYAINDSVELAQDQLLRALNIAKERKANEDIGLLYNNLAGLSQNVDEVMVYMDSAVYYAQFTKNLADLQSFLQNRAFVYTWMGEYEKAYSDLWESFALKDSLFDSQKYEAVAELEEKYESERKSSEIKSLTLEKLNAEVEKLKYKRNQYVLFAGILILALIAGVFGYSFLAIRKNRNILASKNRQILEAQKRSDELLLNILPQEIAQELKDTGKAKAHQYNQVSILFTDLIDFTKAAELMSIEELVEELNYSFKGFDEIVEKYRVEKIKTIGDSYMAAGGLPKPSDDSVKNTVLAALEMQRFMEARRIVRKSENKTAFEMRLGIHTGPIVAGIVGVKKFQYDVWGDTVNTASRLENTGEAGRVNISEATYELLKRDPQFKFQCRGKVQAKGKGEITMYFVDLA